MAQEPFDEEALDRSAYEQAEEQLRLIRDRMPIGAVESLAREVVRRLAFRMPRSVPADHLPDAEEIEQLCRALTSKDEVAGDRIILAARRDGVPMDVIHLSYVAAAARRLGTLWDQDKLTFVQVTLASSRLYRIIRGLRRTIMSVAHSDLDSPAVLFASVPDENHTLGIEIASNLFERAGWDTDVAVGADHDQIVARIEAKPLTAIVLVAETDRHVPQLLALAVAIRIAQPSAHLALAGHVLDHVDDIAKLVGVDSVIDDLETAVEVLSNSVDAQVTKGS